MPPKYFFLLLTTNISLIAAPETKPQERRSGNLLQHQDSKPVSGGVSSFISTDASSGLNEQEFTTSIPQSHCKETVDSSYKNSLMYLHNFIGNLDFKLFIQTHYTWN